MRIDSTGPGYFFFFITLWLLPGSLFAQNPDILNGYYISDTGDSLTGQIHIGNIRGNILRFRASGEASWKKLSPAEVKAAGGENGFYLLTYEIKRNEELERGFVLRLVEGTYRLYEGRTQHEGALFFIQSKERPGLIKVNKLALEPQFTAYFGDCAKNAGLPRLRYTANSLHQYVARMNECADPGQKPVSYAQPLQSRFGIGLHTFFYSIASRTPNASPYEYFIADYHRINKISGGLSAKLNITPAISVIAGVNYIDKRLTTDPMVRILNYTRPEPGQGIINTRNYYRYALDLNFKYLEVPVGISYCLSPYARWSPVFSFGFAFEFTVVSRIENDWGYPFNPPGNNDPLPAGDAGYLAPLWVSTDDVYANFFGGIGMRRLMKNKDELSIKLDYFHQRELSEVGINQIAPKSQLLDVSGNRLQLSVGYCFFF